MNIAVIVCHKMTYDCTGIGCFKAHQEMSHVFDYESNLLALFHCNGCVQPVFEGMDYKFEQLKKNQVKKIHMARCIEVECHRYKQLEEGLIKRGFEVIHGSHK